jgi:hypothetical protein
VFVQTNQKTEYARSTGIKYLTERANMYQENYFITYSGGQKSCNMVKTIYIGVVYLEASTIRRT